MCDEERNKIACLSSAKVSVACLIDIEVVLSRDVFRNKPVATVAAPADQSCLDWVSMGLAHPTDFENVKE